VPSLSEDLIFDVVFSSLGIEGMAPRGHRVDQNEIGRWSWRTECADVSQDAEACFSDISNIHTESQNFAEKQNFAAGVNMDRL